MARKPQKRNRSAKQRRNARKARDRRKRNAPESPDTLGPALFKMPNPFADLSPADRKKEIAEIGADSAKKFEESREALIQILEKYDAVGVLAVLASYGLTVPVGDDGVKIDKTQLQQAHVEICQGIALQISPDKLQKEIATPDVIQEVWEAITTHLESLHYREIDLPDENISESELSILTLQQRIRGNTQLVRNWGFLNQVKSIARELYTPFDQEIEASYGFTISATIDLFEHLLHDIEERNTARFKMLVELKQIVDKTEMIERYHAMIDASRDQLDAFLNEFELDDILHEHLFYMILSHMDLRLRLQYQFSPPEIAESMGIDLQVCRQIFDTFSYEFGALADENPDHLYLSNPIWTRPIIKEGPDSYFCTLPQLFFSFIIPSIERLISAVNKDGLSERRAVYLESKISEIIGRRFPESNTETNFKWQDSGIEYETDLITFIDSHIIIVEAKSGKITDPALRGAPDRIRKHLEEILINPNIQSRRLQEKLERLIVDPDSDTNLRKSLPVDITEIHKIIRVSVSLEDFGSIQSNLNLLEPTGWLPDELLPCPTMTVADFETLFDFLEHPVQIVHYLIRRQELEGVVNFIGDELDLMGWYAGTLFDIDNIDSKTDVVISGMSSDLDAYYNSLDAGIDVPKPKPKVSDLFSQILSQLESRRTPRWTEIGVILNRFSPDVQRTLAKNLVKIRANVRNDWQIDGHENMLILNPSESSEYALAIVLFCDANADRRGEFIDYAGRLALEPKHVTQSLVIAVNIDNTEAAYDFIALIN